MLGRLWGDFGGIRHLKFPVLSRHVLKGMGINGNDLLDIKTPPPCSLIRKDTS